MDNKPSLSSSQHQVGEHLSVSLTPNFTTGGDFDGRGIRNEGTKTLFNY